MTKKIMGHISTVYGCIIGERWRSEDYHRLQRLNKQIIDTLPDNEDVFPWLTRNMFMVPDPDKDKMYCDQVIVVGASYKSVEHEWEEWLQKFEGLLKRLYWSSATIHLETELVGNYRYEWVFDINQANHWTDDNPQPTSLWTFKGGPRKFFDDYK